MEEQYHKVGCTRIFKKYDKDCPRCCELIAGSPARPPWFSARKYEIAIVCGPHAKDHEYRPNPGGYCVTCGWGRDYS